MARIVLIVWAALVLSACFTTSAHAQPNEISIEGPLDILPPFPPPTQKSAKDEALPAPRAYTVEDFLKEPDDVSSHCPSCGYYPQPWGHFYISAEGGAFLIDLPSVRFFQEIGAAGTQFRDTEDGDGPTGNVAVTLGVNLGDPLGLNGRLRSELVGLLAERGLDNNERLNADGSTFGWSAIDGSGAISNFTDDMQTSTTRDLLFAQADWLFKYDISAGANLTVTPFIGVSFLEIDQRITAADQTTGMSLRDDLDASYFGGSIGLELATRLPRNCMFLVHAGFSLYDLDCERDALQTAAGTAIALADRAGRTASQVRLRLEFAHKVGRAEVFFYGGAQYLNAVPLVAYTPGVVGAPSSITFQEAWGYSGGGGVRMPF